MTGAAWFRGDRLAEVVSSPEHTEVVRAAPDERLADEILTTIAGADDVVIVASFLLAWRALLDEVRAAARRGVRVYVMTASEQRLRRRHRTHDELEEERVQEHIELLDQLVEVSLVRTAPGFHAKVVLTDPSTGGAGWLLTANLTHSAMTLNDEIGVRLSEEEVRGVFAVLRFAWWEMADHQASPGALHSIRPAELVDPAQTSPPILALTSREHSLIDELQEAIASSPSLLLTNYSWSSEHPVTQCVRDAAEQGAEVTIVTRVSESTAWAGPVLADLAGVGVRVLGTDRMHAKLLVTDDRTIVHTMNYGMVPDGSGLELGISLDDDRSELVRDIVRNWIDRAPWRLGPIDDPGPGEAIRVPISGDTWEPAALEHAETPR